MKIEPIGYVYECADYTMSVIRATPGEYEPHAVALYTGAQLRQAMEACAVACDYEFQAHKAIKELIKEML